MNKKRIIEYLVILAWIFAFTGMQGASLGYILNHYVGLANGPELIMQAFGLTSIIFVSLSAYAITTKKDFSFMGGFLFAGLLVVIGASLINMFVGNGVAFMAIQAAVAMLMVGLILFDTSRIVNGGETNYIMATVSLYISIYNLFLSLLHDLGHQVELWRVRQGNIKTKTRHLQDQRLWH